MASSTGAGQLGENPGVSPWRRTNTKTAPVVSFHDSTARQPLEYDLRFNCGHSGYRLAATGAIRDTAIDLQEVASFVAEFLLADYPGIVQHRYALQTLPDSDIALLEAIAKKRGCIVSGGKVDYEKVSRLLISELRNGELGGICLETPEMLDQELAALEIIRTRKLEELAAKKSTRLAKKKLN